MSIYFLQNEYFINIYLEIYANYKKDDNIKNDLYRMQYTIQ